MSSLRKQATFGLVFWTVGAVIFVIFFLSGGGPQSFGDDSIRVLMTSIAYGLALLLHFYLTWRFRKKRIGDVVLRDEWDDEVARRAGGVALIIVLLFIYLTGVALWEGYRDVGVAPVGWFWFIGLFSVMVGSMAHAAAMLILDVSRERDAKG